MLKAFPRHTPFATLTPDSTTAHKERNPPRACCIVTTASAENVRYACQK